MRLKSEHVIEIFAPAFSFTDGNLQKALTESVLYWTKIGFQDVRRRWRERELEQDSNAAGRERERKREEGRRRNRQLPHCSLPLSRRELSNRAQFIRLSAYDLCACVRVSPAMREKGGKKEGEEAWIAISLDFSRVWVWLVFNVNLFSTSIEAKLAHALCYRTHRERFVCLPPHLLMPSLFSHKRQPLKNFLSFIAKKHGRPCFVFFCLSFKAQATSFPVIPSLW